jgi:hypothetical protein
MPLHRLEGVEQLTCMCQCMTADKFVEVWCLRIIPASSLTLESCRFEVGPFELFLLSHRRLCPGFCIVIDHCFDIENRSYTL